MNFSGTASTRSGGQGRDGVGREARTKTVGFRRASGRVWRARRDLQRRYRCDRRLHLPALLLVVLQSPVGLRAMAIPLIIFPAADGARFGEDDVTAMSGTVRALVTLAAPRVVPLLADLDARGGN